MKVKKRTGAIVPFDKKYILRAISLAAAAAGEQDESMETETTDMIEQKLKESGEDIIEIETIQDMVEECLFEQQRFRTAKAYILYRREKEHTREEWKSGLLSREFLSTYKHTPNPMEQLGAFVYSRTYSRFIPRYGRREFWWEDCPPGGGVQLFSGAHHKRRGGDSLRQYLSSETVPFRKDLLGRQHQSGGRLSHGEL